MDRSDKERKDKERRDKEKKNEERKWNLNNLARTFIIKKIEQYLGKYLKDIKQKNLKATLGKSPEITIYEIKLRKDALDELRLPVNVLPSSVVREIICQIHIAYSTSQVNIILKGIRIIARPNSTDWTFEQWKNYKINKLREWEQAQKRNFKELNSNSFLKRKMHMLIKNMSISIENMTLYYQDVEALGYPCAVRLFLQEVSIYTTNENWEKSYSNQKDVTYRKIEIKNFSIAMMCEMPNNPALDVEEIFENIQFSERHYLLRPCNITILYKVNHKEFIDEPIHKLEVTSDNISISLNELQKHFLDGVLNLITHKKAYKQYEVFRPVSIISDSPRDWWQYIIKSGIQDLRASLQGLIGAKIKRERYVNLYKRYQNIIHAPWLEIIDKAGIKQMEEIEDFFSLEELTWFRTLALYQLRIEAMSYVKARGNVRGKTHLGDLWDYYLNDFESLLGDPYKKIAEEREIELTEKEKDELTCLLNMDKLDIVNTYLNGKSSSRKDKLFDVKFSIAHLSFYLVATRVPDLEKISMYQDQCFCEKCIRAPRVFDDAPRKFVRPRLSNYEECGYEERNSYEPREPWDVTMRKGDGKCIDSKLVSEQTVCLVEFGKCEGKLCLQRDLQLISENITISNFYVFDPLSLRFTEYLNEFKKTYNYSSGKNLTQIFIWNGVNDIIAANALKSYMTEIGLLSELEYLYHYEEVRARFPKDHKDPKDQSTTSTNLCICGKGFETYEKLFDAFLNPQNELFLHMPLEKRNELVKYSNKKEAAGILYDEIMSFFNEKVMVNFVKCCMRWITQQYKEIPNTNSSGRRKPASGGAINITLTLKGQTSPLQVQFIDKNRKRKEEEITDKEDVGRDFIRIEAHTLDMALTTQTLGSLADWLISSPPIGIFTNMQFKANFLTTLTSPSQPLSNIYDIIKYAKKTPSQLYSILRDVFLKSRRFKFELKLMSFTLGIIESNFKNENSRPTFVKVLLEVIKYEIKQPDFMKIEKSSSSRFRNDFIRDKKFYSNQKITIENIKFETKDLGNDSIHLLLQTKLNLKIKQCIMKYHPNLPETIIDCYLDHFKVFIKKEMITILCLLSTMNFSRNNSQMSEEKYERNKLEKSIMEYDRRQLERLLLSFQNKHYAAPNLKTCLHCLLNTKKVMTVFNFALGRRIQKDMPSDEDSNFVDFKVIGMHQKKEILNLACASIIGMYKKRPFKQTFSLFATTLRSNMGETYKITVYPGVTSQIHESFSRTEDLDCQDITPLFDPSEFRSTSLVAKASGIYDSALNNQRPEILPHFYEILKLDQRINIETFDENKWKERETQLVKHRIRAIETKKSTWIRQSSAPIDCIAKDIVPLNEYDKVILHISSINILLTEQFNRSPVFEAFFIIKNILDLYDLYGKHVKPTNLNVKVAQASKLYINFKIDKVEFICAYEGKILSIISEGFIMQKFSGIESQENLSKDAVKDDKGKTIEIKEERKEIIEERSNISLKRLNIEFGNSLYGFIAGCNFFTKTKYEQVMVYCNGMLYEISSDIHIDKENAIKITEISVSKGQEGTKIMMAPCNVIDKDRFEVSSARWALKINQVENSVEGLVRKKAQGESDFNINPIGILISTEEIFEVKNDIVHFFDILDTEKINEYLAIPSQYIFLDPPIEDYSHNSWRINLSKIFINMKHYNKPISQLYFDKGTIKASINTINNNSEYLLEGNIENLQISPENSIYSKLIEKCENKQGTSLLFKLDPTQDKLSLFISDAKIYFLSSFIDEIIGFVDEITYQLKFSNEINVSEEPSNFSMGFEFENCEIIFPKHSNSDDNVAIKVTKAILRKIEEESCYLISKNKINKNPPIKESSIDSEEKFNNLRSGSGTPIDSNKHTEEDIIAFRPARQSMKLTDKSSIASNPKHKKPQATLLSSLFGISIFDAKAEMNINSSIIPIANSKQAELSIYTPKDIREGKKTKMILKLYETNLGVSFARMTQMTEIMKGNFDEKSQSFPKAETTKKIKFKFKVKNSGIKIRRWLTAELPREAREETQEACQVDESKYLISGSEVAEEKSEDEEPKFTP
ncbi:VPS13_9 [Blepharisma stoltei]|uniref:Chorein N-terminal domain-containing protein n=1 Tax=Blepharisma stoltei TaxID=1481888 RepID=A0AAU9IVM1_9CILI|nr:unnamed protein product [Blepharisma stoltei]